MEDRFRRLRKSMNEMEFNQLNFTEQHKKNIKKKLNQSERSTEDILLAIMQILIHEKTGYELVKLLRGRGIQNFDDNEGYLYIHLHRLEKTNCIISSWEKTGVKYYQLNDKGKRLLEKIEKKQKNKRYVFKALLEG
jgi:DNA-binding PadR family transcriptional regulator